MPASKSIPRWRRNWPQRRHFRRFPNYALAVLSECVADPLRWTSRCLAGAATSPPESWRRGLITGPDHIGDVLFNTPSLPCLRAGLPNCEWSFLTSPGSADVLRGNPHLRKIITVDRSALPAAWSEGGFDVAISYDRGWTFSDQLLALKLKIPNRVGYAYKGFSGLVTHPISLDEFKPYPCYFRDLVASIITRETSPPTDLRPLVYPSSEQESRAGEALHRFGLGGNSKPILACAVTTRQAGGVWPPEKYLETVRWVRDREPCAVVYFGAGPDEPLLRDLARRTGPEAFVLTDLDLRSVVCFLRRCRVALTPDSGSRHLAHAARIPVVFVRSLATRSIEAGSFCATDHDMAPPNLESFSPAEDAAAFAKIRPENVGARVVELLRFTPKEIFE